MKQKDLTLSKMLLPAFAIFFIAAFAMYISRGDASYWVNYDLALQEAASNNKRTIVFYYSRWNAQSKLVENSFFGVDTTRKKLENNYILTHIDVTKQENHDLQKRYMVSSAPYIIILNSRGRESHRIRNLLRPEQFQLMIDDPKPSYVDGWDLYEEAKARATTDSTNLAVFIANTDFGINGVNMFIKVDEIRDFIDANFVPTALLFSDESDHEHIIDITGGLHTFETSGFGITSQKVGELYLFSPEGKQLGHIDLSTDMGNQGEFIKQVKSIMSQDIQESKTKESKIGI